MTIVVADNSLLAGETSLVTCTFSEAVTGFTNADLTIANGTLSVIASANGGIPWTATFTPTAGINDATNVISLNKTQITDLAGNASGSQFIGAINHGLYLKFTGLKLDRIRLITLRVASAGAGESD